MRTSPRFAALAAAAVVIFGACSRTDWTAKLKAEPLYQRVENLRDQGSCAQVPMEFGRSLPVPVKEGAGRLQVLFYPLKISPSGSEAFAPVFAGSFALSSEEAGRCEKLGSAPARSIGKPVPAGLSGADYERAEATLFASLQGTAAAYFSGKAPADPKMTADFADSFLALAEPGLRADYYRLNPDFWEWLRARGGRSLPKP